jgi:hypothetical protein
MSTKVPLSAQISSIATTLRLLETATAKSLNMRAAERSMLIENLAATLATPNYIRKYEAPIKAAIQGDKNDG